MVSEVTALLLALAVSIDGFSAGLSCGLRRLVIPFPSLMVICFSSAAAVATSMLLGGSAARLIPVQYVTIFGGLVLIAIGVYVFYQNIVNGRRKQAGQDKPPQTRRGLKKLSALLMQPEEADTDHSGVLSVREAFMLGLALAADAFGAGFGAVMIGSPLILTVLAVGLIKLLLVPLGLFLGHLMAGGIAFRYTAFVGGAILIFIGIITIF